jgi:hypothetical protein
MAEVPVEDHDGLTCGEDGCDGAIEATVPLWLNLNTDGQWSVHGVGDESAHIVCDQFGHPNATRAMHQSLTAFLDELFPGSTWVGSKPK